MPFLIKNVPTLNKARSKWTSEYLRAHIESGGRGKLDYTRKVLATGFGVDLVDSGLYSFSQWESSGTVGYFRSNSTAHPFLVDDIAPLYAKEPGPDSLFVHKPSAINYEETGFTFRVGSPGTFVQPHYDSCPNYLSMVSGQRRFILFPPSTCETMNVNVTSPERYTARKSQTNFTDVPNMPHLPGLDFVVEGGDVLFIPPMWFHGMVSLTKIIQLTGVADMVTICKSKLLTTTLSYYVGDQTGGAGRLCRLLLQTRD